MAGLYDDRIVGLKEQKEFARRLREQQQEPAGQMVSGWYVPNTGGAVVNALRNVLGAYQERQADEELKSVERERAKDIANVYAQMGVQAPESLLRQAGTEEIKPGMIDRFTALLRGEEAKGTPAQLYQQPALVQNVSPEQNRNALLNLINIAPEHAQNMLALQKLQTEEAKDLRKQQMEKVPTGFMPNEQGQIVPMQIPGFGNYADFQLKQAQAREGFINPVEAQNMAVQLANLDLARKREDRETSKLSEGKDVPANQLSAQTENFNTIKQIDKAIDAVKNNPDAFGFKNFLPGSITQYTDEKGIAPRSTVAELSAVKIHDLSGAAVSPTEMPRFAPFLPSASDRPEKVLSNLQKMKDSLLGMEEERNNMYSDGWKPQLKSLDRFKQPERPSPDGFSIRPLGQ